MNIEKVYYQRNFRISPVADPFLYESIGIGVIVNDNEDAQQALDEAKRLVIKYQFQHQIIEHDHIEVRQIPDIQTEKSTIEFIIDDINKCETIEELKSFYIISNSELLLKNVYENKLKKLTNE